MSKYVRKTYDEYEIQGLYDSRFGWECLIAEDNYKDAKMRLKEYNENERGYPHRIIKHRVRIEDK